MLVDETADFHARQLDGRPAQHFDPGIVEELQIGGGGAVERERRADPHARAIAEQRLLGAARQAQHHLATAGRDLGRLIHLGGADELDAELDRREDERAERGERHPQDQPRSALSPHRRGHAYTDAFRRLNANRPPSRWCHLGVRRGHLTGKLSGP